MGAFESGCSAWKYVTGQRRHRTQGKWLSMSSKASCGVSVTGPRHSREWGGWAGRGSRQASHLCENVGSTYRPGRWNKSPSVPCVPAPSESCLAWSPPLGHSGINAFLCQGNRKVYVRRSPGVCKNCFPWKDTAIQLMASSGSSVMTIFGSPGTSKNLAPARWQSAVSPTCQPHAVWTHHESFLDFLLALATLLSFRRLTLIQDPSPNLLKNPIKHGHGIYGKQDARWHAVKSGAVTRKPSHTGWQDCLGCLKDKPGLRSGLAQV